MVTKQKEKIEVEREPIADVRHELQNFIKFLIGTGKDSLEVKFDLPEREALQRAVQKLDPCAASLIGMIERSGTPEEARAVALLNLWNALASAYTIGSQGTSSENTKVATGNERANTMREAKNKRRRDNPETQIIREEVERNRVGNSDHPYKEAEVVVSAALPRLRKQGSKLTAKQVRERAVRLQKARS